MYCAHCGKELVEGANFCAACGSKSKVAERLAASEGLAPEASGGVSAALASGRSRSRLRMSPLILLVLTLALTAGIAAAAYYVYTEIYLPSVEGSRPAYAPDQEIEFSEPLRSALLPQVDANGDGRIVYAEVEVTSAIALPNPEINDISELSVFANLTELNLNGSGVISADLSSLDFLASIEASETSLEWLDVSGNALLAQLTCPNTTEVAGIDSTQLAERWLMTSCTNTGLRGDRKTIDGTDLFDSAISMFFEYDSKGRLTRRTSTEDFTWAGGSGVIYGVNSEVSYEYGEDGSCIQTNMTSAQYGLRGDNASIDNESIVCEYDDEGRLIQVGQSVIDYSSALFSSISADYGAIQYSVSFDADGLVSSVVRYGTPLVCEYQNGMLSSIGDDRFIYDDNGRWIGREAVNVGLDHSNNTETWSYDDGGKITSGLLQITSDDFIVYTGATQESTHAVSFEYDEHGNVIARHLDGRSSGEMRFDYTRIFVSKEEASDWQPVCFAAGPFDSPLLLEPWERGLLPAFNPICSYMHDALKAHNPFGWEWA